MTNLVRRRFYTRAAPPPADQQNIDGFMAVNGIPHLPAPHLRASDCWMAYQDAITDAADAGLGLFIGIGDGDPAWDETPTEAPDGTTALEALLGIIPTSWSYVEPDVGGSISFAEYGTRWEVSVTQTPYLYCEGTYASTVEPDKSIRELGLYLNPTPDTWPTSYAAAADISDLGSFEAVDRIFIVARTPVTSGKVRFILQVGHG